MPFSVSLMDDPAPADTSPLEEGGMAELLELVRRPNADTLLRVVSEGGRVFVIDAGEVRELADAAGLRVLPQLD